MIKTTDSLPHMPQKPVQSKQFCPLRADRGDQIVRRPHCWVGERRQSQSYHPSTDLAVFVSQRRPKRCMMRSYGQVRYILMKSGKDIEFLLLNRDYFYADYRYLRSKLECTIHLSRPLVGSSRKSNLGLMRISRPMLTLLFSPPLIPRRCQLPMTVSAQSWRPISIIVPSTKARFSSRGILSGRRRRAEYEIISLTVKVPIKVSSCVTYA